MSFYTAQGPSCDVEKCPNDIEMVLIPRSVDLGGFQVYRVLPAKEKRMIGPFVFWDQMGRSEFSEGKGVDVRPHPHIGLSTLTYLFEGAIVHRDNLGSHQVITPGDVNLMTAGSGITHSERTSEQDRLHQHALFGLQCWLGLPKEKEEIDPAFLHHSMNELPYEQADGLTMRVVAGQLHGVKSPVKTVSETLFVDIMLEKGAQLSIPADTEERAIHVVTGNITIGEVTYCTAHMVVLKPGHVVNVTAQNSARIIVMGGASLDGPRYLWWNFVSSSKDRIEQAKQDWLNGKFAPIPGDNDEYIPLPKS